MSADQVFITGATGYAGRYVVAELMHRGLPVTALVRKPVQLEGCRTLIGDLTCDGVVDEVSRARGIIHLASARSYASDTVFAEIADTNFLIEAWRNGPFLYASSGTIQPGHRAPIHEGMPVRINTAHGWIKLCNEFQLRVESHGYQRGAAICIRPGSIFATNQRCFDRQVLGWIYQQCLSGCKFIFDSEEGLENYGTSFIGGSDFGRAMADALGIKEPGTYNVAGGFCTWRRLIELINRVAGTRAELALHRDGRTDPNEFLLPQCRRELNPGSFKAQTGFAPQQSLEQLIEEFARAAQSTARPA